MKRTENLSRRRFAKALAPLVVSSTAISGVARAAANERLTVGVVGAGSRGFNLMDALLRKPEAQIVAVCDVDSFHYRDNAWGKGRAYGRIAAKKHIEKSYAKATKSGSFEGVELYGDFRDLCARNDLDIVVVATPDHWHALCTLEALRKGKDVYCEKPVTHTLREGQKVIREVKSRGAVFQTGSQQRSGWNFRRVVQLARGGFLGQLKSAEVGLPKGYAAAMGDASQKQPPESLDYDFWCGPSPVLPYMRARHHRWWRGHRAYGGGVLMDWIGHHHDIAHWALGMDDGGLMQVEAAGWTKCSSEVYDTPVDYEIKCQYRGGITTSIGTPNRGGVKIIGSDGWVLADRGKLEASDNRWTEKAFRTRVTDVYESDDHMQNFLDCVRRRTRCVAPAQIAHRSITPGHLAYVSHQLGRPLNWDWRLEQVVDDDAANQLLNKTDYRKPWDLG